MACSGAGLVLGSQASGGAGDWPVYHGDTALCGVSAVALPEALSVKWRCRVGRPVSLPPVVCSNTIFAAAEDGLLVAVDAQGGKRWSFTLPKPLDASSLRENFATPPLAVPGFVVIGSDQGVLYALNAASGSVRWQRKVGQDLLGSPNWVSGQGEGGRVVVISRHDGCLKSLSLADGVLAWAAKPVSRSDCSPAVGPGLIAFGACDSALHILSAATGQQAGLIPLGDRGPMAGGCAVDGGQAFIGTRDGSVVCADLGQAAVAWASRCASNEVFTTPAVLSNRVVAGSSDGRVYCLDRGGGGPLWSADVGETPSSPVIAGDKVVVTASGTLYLLSLETGRQIWSDKLADTLTSPALAGSDIVVGTDDGFLVLYGPKGDKP